jgi:hypothetical protein
MPNEQEEKKLTPFEFIKSINPNAPDEQTIRSWQAQAPGNRIRFFQTTDLKRLFIMRGLGGSELAEIQAKLSPSIPPERLQSELMMQIAVRCCLWTSVSSDGKLTDLMLRGAGAGLPQTLNQVINVLSDYCEPETIERLCIELD